MGGGKGLGFHQKIAVLAVRQVQLVLNVTLSEEHDVDMTFTADLLINVSGFSCSRSNVEEGWVGWCLAELVYSTCSFLPGGWCHRRVLVMLTISRGEGRE